MTSIRETDARKTLRAMGLQVESVADARRFGDEFAAVVVSAREGHDRQYERAMEVLTDPRCPLKVVRETTGRDDVRIYVSY